MKMNIAAVAHGRATVRKIDATTGAVKSVRTVENTISSTGLNKIIEAADSTSASTIWSNLNIRITPTSGSTVQLNNATVGGTGASATFTVTDTDVSRTYTVSQLHLRAGNTVYASVTSGLTETKDSGEHLEITWTITISNGTGVSAKMNNLIAAKVRGGTGTDFRDVGIVLVRDDNQGLAGAETIDSDVDDYDASQSLTETISRSNAVMTWTVGSSQSVSSAVNGANYVVLADSSDNVYGRASVSSTDAITNAAISGSITYTLS